MRRSAAAALMVAALGGCVSFQGGPETGGPSAPHWGRSYGPPTVPGVKGPHGESVAMTAPYDNAPPPNAYMARQMMSQNIPLSAVQMNNPNTGMFPPTSVPRGPFLSPPGMPFAPGAPAGMNVPGGPGMMPAGAAMPGNMPMGGGVINANIPPGAMRPGNIMQAQMAQANPALGVRFQGQRTQVRFVRPSGMKIAWFTQGADGKPTYSTTPIEAPGRYNFPQAAIYRLKLSNLEGRPGLEIYPTMEVVPCNPRTEAFLAHSAVPVEFTNDDLKQIAEGNYLVKVIYLPDPQFQDVAGTGTDEIISTRLEPGVDPIQEALRRGSILLVLRMGNVDQEAPNTPPLNAPGPQAALPVPFPGMMPGQPMPGQPVAGQPMPGQPSVPGIRVPLWSVKQPGMQQSPAAPAAPRPFPTALDTMPKTGMPPGMSSTTTFQNVPQRPVNGIPTSITTPGQPLMPPSLPQNDGPAFPPAPASGPDGPTPPPLPLTPVSHGPALPPTMAEMAGQAAQ